MALNKKLIHFLKLADFNTLLAAGNILDTSIVFIKDAKQIYTHGQLYSCSYTESELQELLNNKADATDLTDILTLANQYTDDKVANLVGQAPEALDTVYELAEAMATNLDAVDVLNEAIGKKVDKVTGKGLSTNDYTTAEKDKLAGIAQGATANIGTITGIKMNGASRGSAGVVDLGTVITEHQDISGKLDSEVASATYLKKTDAANTYLPIGDYATKSEIPTKVSELLNDANYISDDVISDGVYAVTADGKLIDYNSADATATGVALVAGEHKFMIAKADATNDGSNYSLYWTYNTSDLSLTNYSKVDGTNGFGYLPKPDGTFDGSTHLSDDFTTWTNGALSDFDGKDNTEVIAAVSSHAKDMCTVLNTFNQTEQTAGRSADWYVPACGQLALMYLNMTEINAALAKIGGTALAAAYYWSSSEGSFDCAWYTSFDYGYVGYFSTKDNGYRVRFVRDISVSKPLKERVSELEELNVIAVDTDEEIDDITNITNITEESISKWGFIKGSELKTINGESILGSGDIKIDGYITPNELQSALMEYATISDLDTKLNKNLYFNNVNANNWISDSTYSDFSYKCDISCNGVTSDMYAEIIFSVEQAISGNYATICETLDNLVRIWSNDNTSIIIPTIIIQQ